MYNIHYAPFVGVLCLFLIDFPLLVNIFRFNISFHRITECYKVSKSMLSITILVHLMFNYHLVEMPNEFGSASEITRSKHLSKINDSVGFV